MGEQRDKVIGLHFEKLEFFFIVLPTSVNPSHIDLVIIYNPYICSYSIHINYKMNTFDHNIYFAMLSYQIQKVVMSSVTNH